MKVRKLLAGIVLTAFSATAAVRPAVAGQVFAKVGTFDGQFLKIGVSARATAMGSAYTAVADDATAVYWNPAGIVNVRGSELSLNQTQWPADIKLSYAAYVFNPRSIYGTFAISARALWMDPQIVRTAFEPDGNGQTFDSGYSSLGLSYARYFTDKFSAGATVHYLHLGLAETSVNTAAADLGIMYRIGIQGMKVGMAIQSLGSQVKFDQREARLPTMFKVGFSFEPIRAGSQKVLAAGEFQHPTDNAERANFGLEYNMRDTFFLRGGYNLNYDTDGLSAGAGFRVKTGRTSNAQLDYSFVDMSSLGGVHRVSLSFGY
jgi:long-subunit fatty acid transport protein